MDILVSVLRTRLKDQQLCSGQPVKSAVATPGLTGSIASNSTTPNRDNRQCHQETAEISFHPRSMNTEDGLVLSSRGDLSFIPRKDEQSLLARMHNWNIMAPFTATLILNLHCFSSLVWCFTGPVTSPLTYLSYTPSPLSISFTSYPTPILVLTLFSCVFHVSPNLLYIATLPLSQYFHCMSLYMIPFFLCGSLFLDFLVPEDGGISLLWNAGNSLHMYMV